MWCLGIVYVGPMQTRARKNIVYGTNIAIILIILKWANI